MHVINHNRVLFCIKYLAADKDQRLIHWEVTRAAKVQPFTKTSVVAGSTGIIL